MSCKLSKDKMSKAEYKPLKNKGNRGAEQDGKGWELETKERKAGEQGMAG